MSIYTMTIRDYVNNKAVLDCPEGTNPLIFIDELSDSDIYDYAKDIFPASYPFFDNTTAVKAEWEEKFIHHFYFHEIGQETIGRFKWVLKDWLDTNMGYFTDLYASRLSSLLEVFKNNDVRITEGVNEGITEAINELLAQTADRSRNSSTLTSGTRSGSRTAVGSRSSQGNGLENDVDFTHAINTTAFDPINKAEKTTGTTGSEETDTAEENSEKNNDNSSMNEAETNSTDSNRKSNRANERILTREYSEEGYRGIDKLKATKEYRDLIIDMDDITFSSAEKNGLFMKLWM